MSSPTVTFFDPQGKIRDVSSGDTDKALASGGEKALLFKAPDGKSRWVRESQKQAALGAGGTLMSAVQDFTANPKGEGTYQMAGPDGKAVGIPYSQVGAASQAKYKMQ